MSLSRRYQSSPRKLRQLLLASLIGQMVDVRLETVDYQTTLFSLSLNDGKVAVAVALRNKDLLSIRDAINDIVNPYPGEPA